MSVLPAVIPPVLQTVIGQPKAVGLIAASIDKPVHAYLFHGPPGSGKRRAAIAFAASLVCPFGGCGQCPACHDALAGRHPDVTVVEREGAAIRVRDARAVAALAQRTPSVASRQVIVLVDFHLVDEAAPAMLKTIEEPPESVVFVLLADALPPTLTTLASRCLLVPFVALDANSVVSALVEEGFDTAVARSTAAAARGRIDRAMLLAGDPDFAARQAHWRSLPERLDGTGATLSAVVEELLGDLDAAVSVVRARQADELAGLLAAAQLQGERSLSGRQELEARYRREQRRLRTDELRAGLATLVDAYRDRLVAPGVPAHRAASMVRACDRIDEAAIWLVRNPNERLFLESLLIDLDDEG